MSEVRAWVLAVLGGGVLVGAVLVLISGRAEEAEPTASVSAPRRAAAPERKPPLPRVQPQIAAEAAGPEESRAEAVPVELPPKDLSADHEGSATDAAPSSAPARTIEGVGSASFALGFDGSTVAMGFGGDGVAPAIEEDVEREGEVLRFPPQARLAYPEAGGIAPDTGTVSFWVRREWGPDEQRSRPLLELHTNTWENRLELGMGPTYIRFMLTNSEGVETPLGSGIRWGDGEWHHVAIAWGEALMSLYLDGQLAEQSPYPGNLALPESSPLFVASSQKGSGPDSGPIALSGLLVFQDPLPADAVSLLPGATFPPEQP